MFFGNWIAWALIEKENMFNEPAAEGFEYAMVKVKEFLKESETEDDSLYFSSMNFNFVSNDGEVYYWATAVIPNKLSKGLYNGGTAAFKFFLGRNGIIGLVIYASITFRVLTRALKVLFAFQINSNTVFHSIVAACYHWYDRYRHNWKTGSL